MSLLKLLSTGSALSGLGERPNQYKLPAGATLPKFAPMNRAISLRPAAMMEKVPVQQNLFEPVKAPAPVEPTVAVASTLKQPEISTLAKMGEVGKAFVRQIFLGQKPRAIRTAVQTELALSKVTPLRNDLHEADLEVVSVKLGNSPVRRTVTERAGGMLGFSRRVSQNNGSTAPAAEPVATRV